MYKIDFKAFIGGASGAFEKFQAVCQASDRLPIANNLPLIHCIASQLCQ